MANKPIVTLFPKITIVMPSYNQVRYLEEALLSVLTQDYPNLELIIMDGGSTDGSLQVIEKYDPQISYWQSLVDQGQSYALSDGFAKSTGEIMGWLNSDDIYEKDAFLKVAQVFEKHPETDWVAFKCQILDENGNMRPGWTKPIEEIERCFVWNNLMQMGVFWRRSLWEKVKGIDVNLSHSMDYDLWFQFREWQPYPYWSDELVACFRLHPASKTSIGGEHITRENAIIHQRYSHLINKPIHRIKLWLYRRDFQAHRLINKQLKESGRGWAKTLLSAVCLAPWILFQRRFFSKVKHWIVIRFSK